VVGLESGSGGWGGDWGHGQKGSGGKQGQSGWRSERYIKLFTRLEKFNLKTKR
jgi:hypothetical protein